MFRILTAPALVLALASGLHAEDTAHQLDANITGLTADGAWDCNDDAGNYLGAIVVADLSYAYIGPDGAVGTYGKLNVDSYSETAFVLLGGALKEKFGAIGMSMTGPLGDPMDYSDWSKVILNVIITEKNIFHCARRQGPAT